MKQYKVGDTVFVKGKIKQIDEDDTSLPYYVDFGNTVWIPSDTIIDELPTAEPVKPVLPKDVADELIEAKTFGYNFLGYMNVALDNEYPSTNMFSFDCDDVHVNKKIKTLSDAWYNGYTVEKEKKYNLILGTDGYDCIHAISKCYDKDGVFIDDETYEVSNLQCDPDYQFTQSEIDKYNKDFWIKNLDLNDYKVEVSADEN